MDAATAPVEFDDRMQEEGTSLLEWFHVLWFRRRLLFSVALFIIVIGAINLMQQKSRYTASSSVMIGVPKSQVVDIKALGSKSNLTSLIPLKFCSFRLSTNIYFAFLAAFFSASVR